MILISYNFMKNSIILINNHQPNFLQITITRHTPPMKCSAKYIYPFAL